MGVRTSDRLTRGVCMSETNMRSIDGIDAEFRLRLVEDGLAIARGRNDYAGAALMAGELSEIYETMADEFDRTRERASRGPSISLERTPFDPNPRGHA
jgi:hypothetical protein